MAKTERQEKIIISAPLFIELGVIKKRKHMINLNQYRNWHYQVNNNIKIAYKEIITPYIRDLSFNKIELKLTLYKSSKRKVDRSNVLSIHEKFFCDALVEAGCLPDDNDEHLIGTHYYTGGIDRVNPRVDIEITRIE